MLRQELDDLQPQQVHRKRGAGGGLIFRIFWSSSLLSRHLAAWIMFPHVCWVRSPAELYGFLRLQCQWSQRNLIDAGESPWFKVVPPKRLCWWASPASSKKKTCLNHDENPRLSTQWFQKQTIPFILQWSTPYFSWLNHHLLYWNTYIPILASSTQHGR